MPNPLSYSYQIPTKLLELEHDRIEGDESTSAHGLAPQRDHESLAAQLAPLMSRLTLTLGIKREVEQLLAGIIRQCTIREKLVSQLQAFERLTRLNVQRDCGQADNPAGTRSTNWDPLQRLGFRLSGLRIQCGGLVEATGSLALLGAAH